VVLFIRFLLFENHSECADGLTLVQAETAASNWHQGSKNERVPISVALSTSNQTPPGQQGGALNGPSSREVTQLLRAWSDGDREALDKLMPLIHHELHHVARRFMAAERPDHTLQATALVNEAYLRLIDWKNVRWQNRAHFFALSARLMRHILVDFARSRLSAKKGAGRSTVTLEEASIVSPKKQPDLIAIDEALSRLAEMDPRKEQVVELRFFGGLSVHETAEVLKVSPETVMRDWKAAKAWLLKEVSDKEIG
jgi:RNA polymerase sigma factor (TIGR02999 family)